MPLPHELYNKIVEFLLSLPNMHDRNAQWALILSAGLDLQLQHQITVGGPPDQFVQLLVSTLLDYGKLEDGRHALEAVLEATKNSVGLDKRNDCDTLIQEFREVRQSWPALVKLVLEADLAECNETRSQDVVHILASILTIEKDSIHILHMEPGSREIILKLPTSSAMELVALFQTHPKKCAQLQQQFLVKEVTLLSTEEYSPRFAVCQWEHEQCAKLDILGRIVPLEKHYQVLPLLHEVKKERLPREPGASKKKKKTKSGLRPIDILRWEEKQREENVTYEKVTLEQVFEDFRSVVKEVKSAVPRFVVLGPPGSGKTTLEQYLAWQAANRKLSTSGRNLIPARVRLREWEMWAVKPADPESSLPEYLTERYKDRTPTPTKEQWRGWLQHGDVFLLLDGLDEISGNQSFLTALKTALDTFKDCPTVLTCRTVSFDQHQNLCPDFSVFTLAGLDDTQRNAYIHIFPVEYPDCYDPDALIEQLNRTPQMRPLAANPLLLSIICYVVDHPRGVTLPARRGELYAKAIEKLLTRPRRHEVTYPGGKSDLPLTRKRRILEYVAFMLFVGIERQQQLTFPEEYLVRALTKAAEREGYRANPAPVVDALLTEITQNSGILRGDAGQGYFFLHLTVQEFLTAAYLARLVNKRKKGWETKFRIRQKTLTIQELVDKKAWNPHWQEVITLLAGQLDDPAPLLEMLSQPDPTSTNPYGDDLFRHRLTLSALCLPELSSKIRNSQSQIIDRITTDAFSLWWRYKMNVISIDYSLWRWHNLHDDTSEPPLTRALSALGQVNGRVRRKNRQDSVPLLDYLAELLRNKKRSVGGAAAEAVRNIGIAAAVPEILVRLADLYLGGLSSDDRSIYEPAERAIEGLGSAAATPEFFARWDELSHNLGMQDHYNPAKGEFYALFDKAVMKRLVNHTRSEMATPEFLTRLRDPDENVRKAAVEKVRGIGSAAPTPTIIACLACLADLLCDQNEDVRGAAIKAVERLGSTAATPAILARLADLLSDPNKDVRGAAIKAVMSLRSTVATPEFLARLADLLHDPKKDVRWTAVEVVKNFGVAAELPKPFAQRLGLAGDGGKIYLGSVATPTILTRLAELLRDPESRVRRVAVEAVGRLGSAAATPAILTCLADLLRDPKKGVRWTAAAEAVGRLGSAAATPTILTRLAELLRDPESRVRRVAVEAVGRLGSAAATPEILACLADLLRDPDKDVWWTAAEAIGALGSAAATPEILACLANLWHDPYVREAVIKAVGNIGSTVATPNILTRLVKLLRNRDEDVRWAAAEALAHLGAQDVRIFEKRRWFFRREYEGRTVGELSQLKIED